MEKKELENIGEFFGKETVNPAVTPEKRWQEIFNGWLEKLDQDKQMLNLFELKLWLESLEEFYASGLLESLVFKGQAGPERNFEYYLSTFNLVATRMLTLLKDLDFKKDKYLLNFEEFIVDKLLEEGTPKIETNIKEVYSAESWFDNFRIFLQNLRTITADIMRLDTVPMRSFAAVKKLYHKELINNPVLLMLMKRQFITKMDKIFQPDISQIISASKDKNLKKTLGIFFVLSFRILKITNFIELNLNHSKVLDLTVPLILALKKHFDILLNFNSTVLVKALDASQPAGKELDNLKEIIGNLEMEYKKIFEGELPLYFDSESNKIKKRKMIQNIVIISEVAIQEVIEQTARLYRPEISGGNIFENYVSRRQKSIEVKKKLIKLHTKINDYFAHPDSISPSEIFFDINLFLETDLNYLLYKDWNEFLNHYDNLSHSNFSAAFEPTLRAFHSFLTRVLKEIVSER